jgi:hypothetical protein
MLLCATRHRLQLQVLLATGGGKVTLLEASGPEGGGLREAGALEVGAEVACLDISPLGGYLKLLASCDCMCLHPQAWYLYAWTYCLFQSVIAAVMTGTKGSPTQQVVAMEALGLYG